VVRDALSFLRPIFPCWRRTLLCAAALLTLVWSHPAAASDADAIRQSLVAMFDKPDMRLAVNPVVVAGEYAIAGWVQADMGGRALLRLRHGKWTILLCAGDAMKSGEALRHAGVPEPDAKLLVNRLAEAEAALPQDRLAMFAKFDGIVMVDAAGTHLRHQMGVKQ
jgi:hypothetical protein